MHARFIALDAAEDAAAAVLLLVHPLGGRYASLADQARRAAASAALNLAEGGPGLHGPQARGRTVRWTVR